MQSKPNYSVYFGELETAFLMEQREIERRLGRGTQAPTRAKVSG